MEIITLSGVSRLEELSPLACAPTIAILNNQRTSNYTKQLPLKNNDIRDKEIKDLRQITPISKEAVIFNSI